MKREAVRQPASSSLYDFEVELTKNKKKFP